MKKWQLHDVIENKVVAESDEYMELDEFRKKLLEKWESTIIGKPFIDYREDPSKGDLKGKWVICNEKSELFKKRKNKKQTI